MTGKKKRTTPKDTYRVIDVAEMLDCSDTQIRKMIRANRIPGACRFGPRMIRFRKATVDAWIAEKMAAAN